MLNIEKSFLTENSSVYDYLNEPGQGFYIPLYQREYSWGEDNIEQLLEDITRGIERLASGEVVDDNKEIRFLGTLITVIESNKNNIYPVDRKAVPAKIEKIIDGQQRISTIALISTLLLKRLYEIKSKVKDTNPIFEQIEEIYSSWKSKLQAIFCFDLQRGTPTLKPKVVRGAKDYWTIDKNVDEAYKSELSNYLGHFIDAYIKNMDLPDVQKPAEGNSRLYENANQVKKWLDKSVTVAHTSDEEDAFSKAEDILNNMKQDMLWGYERPDLVDIIKEKDFSSKKTDSYILCEMVQVIAVCHYLLDRCCFTVIQPTDDDWAFDMFQSLNATGTPLTAIETFKPTVVNTTDNEPGYQFKGSECEKYFKKIEDYLSGTSTAQQKNKATNDYLTSFFITVDGRSMSTHFSFQRKALDTVYNSFTNYSDKEAFVKHMGNYAYFYDLWSKYNGSDTFPLLSGKDADLASLLILFLKESNHKMAITVLARMYERVIEKEENGVQDFIKTVKIIASYFFLWRSSFPNQGLDASYREFFKRLHNEGKKISLAEVCVFAKDSLSKKGISDFDSWNTVASKYLNYKSANKNIVRIALLASAHETAAQKGSIVIGKPGTSQYLIREKWLSKDLKSIEHVAPQTNKNGMWDNQLYDPIEFYQDLGNLTLLPQDINSSVGNKGWDEKRFYYSCVTNKKNQTDDELKQDALEKGIVLCDSTFSMLRECTYNDHLESIVELPDDMTWNAELVQRRTNDILKIVWKRLGFVFE